MQNKIIKNITLVLTITLFLLLTLSSYANKFDLLREEILLQQQKFPVGNLNQVEYVKEIIHKMVKLDQKIRNLPLEDNEPARFEIYSAVDTFNTAKMKKILAQHTWITISKFGKQTNDDAFLLVQHADLEPFFQAGCLFILSNLINKTETAKSHYPYLYDRVALAFNMKQRYGTQFMLKDNNFLLSPYEGNIDELNQRRKEMDLGTIAEYLKIIKEKILKKK